MFTKTFTAPEECEDTDTVTNDPAPAPAYTEPEEPDEGKCYSLFIVYLQYIPSYV